MLIQMVPHGKSWGKIHLCTLDVCLHMKAVTLGGEEEEDEKRRRRIRRQQGEEEEERRT